MKIAPLKVTHYIYPVSLAVNQLHASMKVQPGVTFMSAMRNGTSINSKSGKSMISQTSDFIKLTYSFLSFMKTNREVFKQTARVGKHIPEITEDFPIVSDDIKSRENCGGIQRITTHSLIQYLHTNILRFTLNACRPSCTTFAY